MSHTESDYLKYRGKCKEMSEDLLKNNPELRLVRGHYDCPMWGMQAHWWCVDKEGKIHDPTVKQFPTSGIAAEYIEFNGFLSCNQCGKEVEESEARFNGNYGFCTTKCAMRFVGL